MPVCWGRADAADPADDVVEAEVAASLYPLEPRMSLITEYYPKALRYEVASGALTVTELEQRVKESAWLMGLSV